MFKELGTMQAYKKHDCYYAGPASIEQPIIAHELVNPRPRRLSQTFLLPCYGYCLQPFSHRYHSVCPRLLSDSLFLPSVDFSGYS